MTKVQFPTTIGILIRLMVDLGWTYLRESGSRRAVRSVGGECHRKWVKEGKTPTLARRLALTVVTFFKEGRRVRVCVKCGWTDRPVRKQAPPTPPPVEEAPSVPMCDRCGQEPIPKGRKSLCYTCRPKTRPKQQKLQV